MATVNVATTKLPADTIIGLTPDVWTQPFWDAAAQHRLVIPKCTACGAFRLPPSAFCWKCRAQDVEWVEHDGRGQVYAFTVIWHPLLPDVADTVPYAPCVVELPNTNSCRLVGAMVEGVSTDDVRIGMDVELVWRDVSEGTSVPTWRPV
ncbi:MAG: acyl dehydratase [Actinobacteria bacterium]|nr:acyl dehydratase [Actinomycetota bacterium]